MRGTWHATHAVEEPGTTLQTEDRSSARCAKEEAVRARPIPNGSGLANPVREPARRKEHEPMSKTLVLKLLPLRFVCRWRSAR